MTFSLVQGCCCRWGPLLLVPPFAWKTLFDVLGNQTLYFYYRWSIGGCQLYKNVCSHNLNHFLLNHSIRFVLFLTHAAACVSCPSLYYKLWWLSRGPRSCMPIGHLFVMSNLWSIRRLLNETHILPLQSVYSYSISEYLTWKVALQLLGLGPCKQV